MPVPTIDPDQRPPADIVPTDRYRPTDPVWIFRGGSWRAGVIEAASTRAATVTYRPNNTPGTAVDTLTAQYILPRSETDPLLNSAGGVMHDAGATPEPIYMSVYADPTPGQSR